MPKELAFVLALMKSLLGEKKGKKKQFLCTKEVGLIMILKLNKDTIKENLYANQFLIDRNKT